MSAPLNEEVALRIGLACRALPGVDTRTLLQELIAILGEPLTTRKLQKLRASRLRSANAGQFAALDPDAFQKAIGLLKGRGVKREPEPIPSIVAGDFCVLYGSVRVACASSAGEKIDSAFQDCPRFLIYQVSPEHIRLIDIREPTDRQQASRDRHQYRAQLIRDCDVLYTTHIGAAAAAKVVGAGLHSIRLEQAAPALDQLTMLQTVVKQESPPPWLMRAMGRTPRMRSFNEEMST